MATEPSTWDMTPRQRWAWVLGTLTALALLFRFVPQLDLAVAALFHDELGFSPGRRGLNGVFYWLGDTGAELLFVALTLAMFGGILRLGRLAAWRARLVFLWLALFLGPGVMVNLVLKAEIDRPRPSQLAEFGGDQQFRAAFDWRDTPARGHSFVSGHAAFAFYLMALAWVQPRSRRRWMFAAIVAGAAMGLARMDAGQHFLSDVLFAWYVVYGCCTASWWLTQRFMSPDP